jgi:hypothetical protein
MALMASLSAVNLTGRQRADLETLVSDLRTIFGARLHSVVAYGLAGLPGDAAYVRTLALTERVTFEDLARAVPLTAAWQRRGLAVPLILSRHEFERTLDVFPLEYGNLIASHVVIAGGDPFGGVRVADADRRRGCEQQAKSHLIHLREGFLETQGDPSSVVRLVASSAAAFRTLLFNLTQLGSTQLSSTGLEHDGSVETDAPALAAEIERIIGVPTALIVEVLSAPSGMSTMADPTALLARYVDASERIWRYVDGWRA